MPRGLFDLDKMNFSLCGLHDCHAESANGPPQAESIWQSNWKDTSSRNSNVVRRPDSSAAGQPCPERSDDRDCLAKKDNRLTWPGQ